MLHGFMKIEMILSDVSQGGDGKVAGCYALLSERVAGYFHGDVRDMANDHFMQQLLQLRSLWSRVVHVQIFARTVLIETSSQCAYQTDTFLRVLKNMFDQVGRCRFAVRSRYS